MPGYMCGECGIRFEVPAAALARYPGWRPSKCMACRPPAKRGVQPKRASTTTLESGTQTGIFTDGSCDPNPGPGGWGAVKVRAGIVVDERSGSANGMTTNNRMELRALIEAFAMLDGDEAIVIYSDSALCVNTINIWAAKWEKNGWKKGKSGGDVKNVDLVQELFALAASSPNARIEWIKGHSLSQWNAYADELARRYRDGGAS